MLNDVLDFQDVILFGGESRKRRRERQDTSDGLQEKFRRMVKGTLPFSSIAEALSDSLTRQPRANSTPLDRLKTGDNITNSTVGWVSDRALATVFGGTQKQQAQLSMASRDTYLKMDLYAQLSDAAYDDTRDLTKIEQNLGHPVRLDTELSTDDTIVVVDDVTNRVYVAYRGTKAMRDLTSDAIIATGTESLAAKVGRFFGRSLLLFGDSFAEEGAQAAVGATINEGIGRFKNADDIFDAAATKYAGYTMSVTGHSLGGNLALQEGRRTGVETHVFQPGAGLSELERQQSTGDDVDNSNITYYRTYHGDKRDLSVEDFKKQVEASGGDFESVMNSQIPSIWNVLGDLYGWTGLGDPISLLGTAGTSDRTVYVEKTAPLYHSHNNYINDTMRFIDETGNEVFVDRNELLGLNGDASEEDSRQYNVPTHNRFTQYSMSRGSSYSSGRGDFVQENRTQPSRDFALQQQAVENAAEGAN